MTSNKEHYLKVLYEEGGTSKPVPNRILAKRLGIAAPSVSEMLTKLAAQGLISYEAYKGSMLTEKGMDACLDVVRSHELWEVFLSRHLGYSWREAHEDAHLLEHVSSARMMERLDAFLNHPETCPHGAQIPQRGAAPQPLELSPLSAMSIGARAYIQCINEDGELLDYVEQSGLKLHEEIEITKKEPFEGAIHFKQGDRSISLTHKAATQVFVRSAEHP